MSLSLGTLVGYLDADSSGLDKGIDRSEKRMTGLGGHAKRVVGMIGGAFAGIAVAGFLKDSVAEARESAKVGALTAQVIKSTGGAAKVTAGQVGQLATAISNKTGIDDEAIQSASNLLLTFTNVRNEVGKGNDIFNQATATAADMAATLGGDASSQAIALGKALNDPVKGVTALSRVGVSFTEQQKTQIKTLVAHNDTLGAQKIILGELSKEFGGSAAAQATAGDKAKVAFGNLKESIGSALLPILERLATFASGTLIPALYKLAGFLRSVFGPVFSGIGRAVRDFTSGLKGVGPGMDGIWSIARQLGLGIAALWASFREGDVTSDGLVGKFEMVGDFLHRTLLPAFAAVWRFFTGSFLPAVKQIGDFMLTRVFPVLGKIAQFLISTFTPTFRALANYITGTLIPAWQGLAKRIQDNMPQLQAIAKVIGTVIAVVAMLVAKIVGFLLPILVQLAGFLGKTLFAAIGVAIGIIGAMVRAIGGIITGVSNVISWVKGNWPLILGILTGPIGLAVLYISRHWDSIVKTVKGLPGRIASAASGMWDGIKNAFRSAINWIIDKWNGLEFGMDAKKIAGVTVVPGFHIGTPNIPRLAKGGVIRARPGGTLALLGEGGHDEQVTPLDGKHGAGMNLKIIIQNPTPEPASESVSRSLRRLAVIGIVPGPVTG